MANEGDVLPSFQRLFYAKIFPTNLANRLQESVQSMETETNLDIDTSMPHWLYTIRERFTSNPRQRFDDYRAFSGFHQITELVTLDSMMCPDLVNELRTEDWEFNVQEDFRTELFRSADYLLSRQPLDRSKHQLLAVLECPPSQLAVPNGFTICGYDIMDSFFGNSTLTNCGPIPEAFLPADVNEFGLIDDRHKAIAIRDKMKSLGPDDDHLGDCQVWLIARQLPDVRYSTN